MKNLKNISALLGIFGLLSIGVLQGQTHAARTYGSLRGKVTNSEGIPLPGATVLLEPDRHLALADSGGNFTFDRLFPGTYQLFVTFMGYEPYRGQVAIDGGKTVAISVLLNEGNGRLDQVTVTGGRSPAPDNLVRLERSGMPVQVITRRQIELMGSRRLDEVLKEQTGIAIVSNIGGGNRSVGVQLQGFGSEYVMVLIDGQPMVGRNGGNFDLSRISVSNIERIEIVKGASSCLFGSEAMGGAINIITRHGALEPQAQASVSYGSLHTVDATLEGEMPFSHQRGSASVSTNFYRIDGFNTNPYLKSGVTSPPYDNFSLQGRFRYRTGKNSTLGTSLRYGLRKSYMPKDWGDGRTSGDSQDERDFNGSLTFDHDLRSGVRAMSRYYYTRYCTDEQVRWSGADAATGLQSFVQDIHRLEQQLAYRLSNGINLTGGAGASLETMHDRDFEGAKRLATGFGYVQGDWLIREKVSLMGGARYDHTGSYGGRLNPSLGVQYHLTPKLTLKTGVGTGFKAPDFRMRYQVFFNPSANYLVIGNDLLKETLEQMQASGQISEIRHYMVGQLGRRLKAERSTSYNAGAAWKPTSWGTLEAGGFFHSIRDQINAVMVATGTGISQIYSYQNLPRAVNKGVEATFSVRLKNGLEVSSGYQYLISRDLSVTDSIRAGNWPYNQNIHDPATGASFAPRPSDYWGIENRSRHMLNIRAFYTYKPWDLSVNIRLNYRGKYPFMDYNGNQFIDRYDLFVPGHTLLNAAVEKRLLKQHLSIRFTADNIGGFKHQFMPGQPGTVLLLGAAYRWFKS